MSDNNDRRRYPPSQSRTYRERPEAFSMNNRNNTTSIPTQSWLRCFNGNRWTGSSPAASLPLQGYNSTTQYDRHLPAESYEIAPQGGQVYTGPSGYAVSSSSVGLQLRAEQQNERLPIRGSLMHNQALTSAYARPSPYQTRPCDVEQSPGNVERGYRQGSSYPVANTFNQCAGLNAGAIESWTAQSLDTQRQTAAEGVSEHQTKGLASVDDSPNPNSDFLQTERYSPVMSSSPYYPGSHEGYFVSSQGPTDWTFLEGSSKALSLAQDAFSEIETTEALTQSSPARLGEPWGELAYDASTSSENMMNPSEEGWSSLGTRSPSLDIVSNGTSEFTGPTTSTSSFDTDLVDSVGTVRPLVPERRLQPATQSTGKSGKATMERSQRGRPKEKRRHATQLDQADGDIGRSCSIGSSEFGCTNPTNLQKDWVFPTSRQLLGSEESLPGRHSSHVLAPSLSPSHTLPLVLYCSQEGCGIAFNGEYRQGNLARHKRLRHSQPDGSAKEILCEERDCGRRFKRTDARLKHYRKHHPHRSRSPIPRKIAPRQPF